MNIVLSEYELFLFFNPSLRMCFFLTDLDREEGRETSISCLQYTTQLGIKPAA